MVRLATLRHTMDYPDPYSLEDLLSEVINCVPKPNLRHLMYVQEELEERKREYKHKLIKNVWNQLKVKYRREHGLRQLMAMCQLGPPRKRRRKGK